MKDRKTPQTNLRDRRTAPRQSILGKVRVRLDAQGLEGDGDNVSRSGILFYTQGDVEVEVEFEENGVVQRRKGHLVRCERIRGERRGWAVEFER